MALLFGILSVLCLIYYGVILVYSGFGTSFSVIWPVLACFCGLLSLTAHFFARIRERISLRAEVSFVTVIAAMFAVFVIVEAAMAISAVTLKNQSVDYVIVLDTQVRGSEISRTLKYRLDRAAEYAKLHPNTVFVLSGGQGDGEDVSEAAAMYEYLKEHGVAEYQMLKEERSESTYENLVYSKLLINEREKNRLDWIKNLMAQSGYLVPPDEEVSIRVGIVTSNFHMLRAKGIAKQIGIPNVSGIAARSDLILLPHFCVRECFAILKDSFMGNM